MTRVLVVHNRYRSRYVSGENRAVEQEIELLRAAGHRVVTYLRSSDEIEGLGMARRLEVPARVVWSERDRRAIRALASTERPHVVHIHNTFPLISPSVIHGIASLRIPIVMTLHNYRLFCANGALLRDGRPCELCLGSSALPGLRHACYRGSRSATAPLTASISVHRRLRTWDRVTSFIVLSHFARGKVIEGGLDPTRVHVKPNAVAPPNTVHRNDLEHFLFLGRLTEEKGADLLLDAWSEAFGRLVIAGEGPLRAALEHRAARFGAGVVLPGYQQPEACANLLDRARALVVPSKAYEGFPIAVVEAFAHGVPVIAPDHGPFPEIVRNGHDGLLYRPGDPHDLAGCMHHMLDDGRVRSMGATARRTYEARYTPEHGLALLEGIYRRARSPGRELGVSTRPVGSGRFSGMDVDG